MLPRGARRVLVDPVDPHQVYASFFARGIWRSNHDGAAGSWEQIMAPVDPLAVPGAGKSTTERPEFDVVADPATHETRMYVGVGGGTVYARFRENLAVRSAPAAAVAASWIDKSSATPTNPTSGTSSGYCDTQCSYDNYVYIPAAHFPQSGASTRHRPISPAPIVMRRTTGAPSASIAARTTRRPAAPTAAR